MFNAGHAMNCLWQRMRIENNYLFYNLLCVRISGFVCASLNLKYVICITKVYLLYAEYPGYAALLTWFYLQPRPPSRCYSARKQVNEE